MSCRLSTVWKKTQIFTPEFTRNHFTEDLFGKLLISRNFGQKFNYLHCAVLTFLFILQEVISETTAKLEETTAQRDKTQRALDCTKTVLHKTEFERAEQVSQKEVV